MKAKTRYIVAAVMVFIGLMGIGTAYAWGQSMTGSHPAFHEKQYDTPCEDCPYE